MRACNIHASLHVGQKIIELRNFVITYPSNDDFRQFPAANQFERIEILANVMTLSKITANKSAVSDADKTFQGVKGVLDETTCSRNKTTIQFH
jgi:hypothetical protein